MNEKVQDVKPGIKSTEFWKSVIVQVVAIILGAYGTYIGDPVMIGVAGAMMAAVQSSYNVGRGLAKKSSVLSLAFCLVFLTGCGGPGYIRAAAVEGPILRIVAQHRLYVEKDAELTPLERRSNIRDGELVTKIVLEAREEE